MAKAGIKGIVWNHETLSRLRDLAATNPSVPPIAETMGLTVSAVYAAMHRFSIPLRESPLCRSGNRPDAVTIRKCMCCDRPFGSGGKPLVLDADDEAALEAMEM
jgi:hypothetical protein